MEPDSWSLLEEHGLPDGFFQVPCCYFFNTRVQDSSFSLRPWRLEVLRVPCYPRHCGAWRPTNWRPRLGTWCKARDTSGCRDPDLWPVAAFPLFNLSRRPLKIKGMCGLGFCQQKWVHPCAHGHWRCGGGVAAVRGDNMGGAPLQINVGHLEHKKDTDMRLGVPFAFLTQVTCL